MPTDYSIPISKLEKKFGPYIPGKGEPSHTISAIKQVTSGKARGTYLGVPGIVPGAEFHVQFPTPVRLEEFTVSARGAKRSADSVKDLASDGPQGAQERRAEFEAWRLALAWESELQKLSGDFPAELHIPTLKKRFAVTISVSGAAGKKKVALRGKLAPL